MARVMNFGLSDLGVLFQLHCSPCQLFSLITRRLFLVVVEFGERVVESIVICELHQDVQNMITPDQGKKNLHLVIQLGHGLPDRLEHVAELFIGVRILLSMSSIRGPTMTQGSSRMARSPPTFLIICTASRCLLRILYSPMMG